MTPAQEKTEALVKDIGMESVLANLDLMVVRLIDKMDARSFEYLNVLHENLRKTLLDYRNRNEG